jgi:glycosyltransferase involved in cell wall biosynthesis
MNEPNLSVVVTNYNYALYLEAAVQSLLDQTRKPQQIIVVDDCSTDGSRKVIEELSSRSALTGIILDENVGQMGAFNAGVAVATGDVIAFLDADDTWAPECAEEILSVYQKHPECDFLFTGYRTFGNHEGETFTADEPELRDLGLTQFITWIDRAWISSPTSAISMRATLARRIFPVKLVEEWRIQADAGIQLLASLEGGRKFRLSKPLMNYRSHGDNRFLSKAISPLNKIKTESAFASTVSWFCAQREPCLNHMALMNSLNMREGRKIGELLYLEASTGNKTEKLLRKYKKVILKMRGLGFLRKLSLVRKMGRL